jgi:hypothetical protein
MTTMLTYETEYYIVIDGVSWSYGEAIHLALADMDIEARYPSLYSHLYGGPKQ